MVIMALAVGGMLNTDTYTCLLDNTNDLARKKIG